jgi:hypothetical protein
MNCNQVNGMLDMLMDGTLDDVQRGALEAHGRECPTCAAVIRATLQMKALFEQMEPEADVPLAAQARWRGAVKAESKQQRQKRMRRWIASVAAAAVVLVGIGAAFTLKNAPKRNDALYVREESAEAPVAENAAEPVLASNGTVTNERFDAAPGAVVEADGMADEVVAIGDATAGMAAAEEEAESPASGQRVPACELALKVEDVETACNRVCDLAQEYEAVADVQSVADGGANVYVEIDAENAADFLNAVAPMDKSEKPIDVPALAGSGRVLRLLVLHS